MANRIDNINLDEMLDKMEREMTHIERMVNNGIQNISSDDTGIGSKQRLVWLAAQIRLSAGRIEGQLKKK